MDVLGNVHDHGKLLDHFGVVADVRSDARGRESSPQGLGSEQSPARQGLTLSLPD